MELIPTQRKEKLPQGYTYPVGAESLSHALQGIPKYSELSITFSWRDTFWASKYQAKLKAQGAIDILVLHHFSAIGAHPDRWTISVHAVPSKHSQRASETVAAIALPALRSVLLGPLAAPSYSYWKATYDLACGNVQVST